MKTTTPTATNQQIIDTHNKWYQSVKEEYLQQSRMRF